MIKLLLLFMCSLVFAEPTVTYSIGGSVVVFTKTDGMYFNQACESKCQAYQQAIKFKDQKIAAADRVGGKNPGSVRCKKYLGGVVVIGRDSKGNQQSFCHFTDDSYLMSKY